MKKIIAAVTSWVLVLGLVGCSFNEEQLTDFQKFENYVQSKSTETNPVAIKIKEDVIAWFSQLEDYEDDLAEISDEVWDDYERSAMLESSYVHISFPTEGYTSIEKYFEDLIYYRDEVLADYNYLTEGGKWVVDDCTFVCNYLIDRYQSGEDVYFLGDSGEVLCVGVEYYDMYCDHPEWYNDNADALYRFKMYEKHVLGIDKDANQSEEIYSSDGFSYWYPKIPLFHAYDNDADNAASLLAYMDLLDNYHSSLEECCGKAQAANKTDVAEECLNLLCDIGYSISLESTNEELAYMAEMMWLYYTSEYDRMAGVESENPHNYRAFSQGYYSLMESCGISESAVAVMYDRYLYEMNGQEGT